MQSGIVYGYVGLVDGMVGRLREELGDAVVIATGGLARLIAPLSSTISEAVDELTLEGLRIIHERNPQHASRA
jgi:type III pantothenate kinase